MQPDWSYIRLVTELLAEAVEARSAAQPPLSARSDPTGQTSSGSLPPDDPGGRIEEPRRTGTMPTPHAAHPSASLSADDQRNPYGFDNSSATMVPGALHSATHGSMQPAMSYSSPSAFNDPDTSVFSAPDIQQEGQNGQNLQFLREAFSTRQAASAAHPEARTTQPHYIDQGAMSQLQSLAFQQQYLPALLAANQHVFATPQMQQSLGGMLAEGQAFTTRPVAPVAHNPEDRTQQQHYTDQGMLQLQSMALQHLHMPGSEGSAIPALRAADQHVLTAPQLQQQSVGGAHEALASNQNDSDAPKQKGPRIRPKRTLTAYNIFFKDQRAKLLAGQEKAEALLHTADGTKRKRRSSPHGKIGFEAMAKTIGKLWKAIEPEELAYYKKMAAADKKRFEGELVLFMKDQCDDMETARAALEATVSEETKRLYFNRKL
jgi:hypothetical protein